MAGLMTPRENPVQRISVDHVASLIASNGTPERTQSACVSMERIAKLNIDEEPIIRHMLTMKTLLHCVQGFDAVEVAGERLVHRL